MDKSDRYDSRINKSLIRHSSVQLSNKPQKSILSTTTRHVQLLKVMHEGIDVTPLPIPASVYRGSKERPLNVYMSTDREESEEMTYSGIRGQSLSSKVFNESALRFQTDLMHYSQRGSMRNSVATILEDSQMQFVMSFDTEEEDDKRKSMITTGTSKSQVSQIEENEQMVVSMPKHITLVLKETDTFFLFELNSSTVDKDSEEGTNVDNDNKLYEYLTVGKGRNRKVLSSEVQTTQILLKNQETQIKSKKYLNHRTFASLWDMYDTFHEEEDTPLAIEAEVGQSDETYALSKEEREWQQLLKNDRFQEAMCVIQRLLANNVFNEQQKRFRGLKDPSPFRENIEYNYKLELLWTFANDNTKGHCVSALAFNPENNDLIAAGYGKFLYDEETFGMVYMWNIKNCVQPEREYYFTSPVTSLDFSKQNPNLLAVGFHDGNIRVIDITARNVRILGIDNKAQSQLFEPIWQVHWYTDHDYYKGQEFLAATCQDGRICKFLLTTQGALMQYSRLMQVTMAEGKLKGIETFRKCASKSIQLARHSPALVYTPHPVDPNIYYIGTGEGVVHKCSKNYYHQHLDLFLAHDSPLYAVAFSPFCTKLFLTCGDDWAIRLWADGINEPLFEIKKRMAGVQDVAWSPSHSTIVASISGNEIFIWDFQRKTYDSQSVTVSPTKARNTLLKFTNDGRCLLVADIEGNINVFSLEDMPFPAFFQENLLTESIKRALVTRPDLLNRIEKLGSLAFDTKPFEKYYTN